MTIPPPAGVQYGYGDGVGGGAATGAATGIGAAGVAAAVGGAVGASNLPCDTSTSGPPITGTVIEVGIAGDPWNAAAGAWCWAIRFDSARSVRYVLLGVV